MAGIAVGYGKAVPQDVQKMLETIVHRGPAWCGIVEQPPAILGQNYGPADDYGPADAGSTQRIARGWDAGRDGPAFDEPDAAFAEAAFRLLDLSGFPEPFSAGTREFYRRWQDNHLSLILREDIRDLTKIAGLRQLETLVFLLPDRVGSPVSLNSLKNILGCAHGSVRSWLGALEKVFLVFPVSPFAGRLARAVVKEKKYYFWDWGIHDDPGRRLENFVAVQLQRAVAAWNEWGRGHFRLTYVRTRDGRESDFLIVDRNSPRLIIECRTAGSALSPSLAYFKERLAVPFGIQVNAESGGLRQIARNVYAAGLDRFLSLLP